MRFETFKSILLSVGICECEFYLHSTNKEGFIGYTTENDKKKYCVVFDKGEFYFDKDVDILTGKVINGKTLEEVWDDIEICFIDGLNDEEYVDYIDTPNFYLNEFVALNKVTNTLEVESLINKLKKSEYNGNILLYAGSKELSEFSNQDNEYTYYIFDTFNKGIYLLKKENDIVSFVYLMHWYQKNKLKISGLSIGRKFDKFSLKSGINKSERYSLMLKFQRNQSQDIVGGIFAIIDIIIFILILCGIGLKTIYPMFVYYSLISFVVSMFFTFLFSSLHNRVTHKYMLFDHIEKKDIGIYSSLEKANMEINLLQDKNGFKETKDCFFVKKVFKFTKPKLLDKTFWIDGFDTYYYVENMSKKISCDETRHIMKHFSFLIKEYGFKFDKIELGDLRDENGKLWFYGPFNCYSFFNDNLCINFMNLVQRQDWYITITKEPSSDQIYLKKGQSIEDRYCYNWDLLSSVIKNDIKQFKTIFGNSIDRE